MEDKNAEMSLDEVLSSIKKMVIDEKPPVLELTDIISADGSIVKVKKNKDCKNNDMGSFLKLIQENQDNVPESQICNFQQKRGQKDTQFSQEKHDVISGIVREILPAILQKWINDNLPKIVSNIVEEEVKGFLYQKNRK